MPARKSAFRVIVEANGKRFALNCEEMLFGRYRVKVGRSVSQKHPSMTITGIYDLARRWTAAQERKRKSLPRVAAKG